MSEEKKLTRNERVCKLANAVAAAGYEIRKIEFLIDDNEQDKETAVQSGLPFVELTLSL